MQISVMACLALSMSDRKSSLVGGIVAAFFSGLLLTRSSVTLERIKGFLRPWHVAVGILFCAGLGRSFYERWVISPRVLNLAGSLGLLPENLVLPCALAGAVAAVFSVSVCLACYVALAEEDFRKRGGDGSGFLKAFLPLGIIYTLGISAILRANFNYIDDMDRVAQGYKNWANYSRFISEALSSVIHMDQYLTDVSPLPQLIAAALLALTGSLLLYVVHERTSFSVWEILALVPLGLNPYFLECLSYKYDAPYMALSILVAVVPFLFRKRKPAVYMFISALGTIAVCTTYQAATGIFPMMVVLLAFQMWNSGDSLRNTGRFCLHSAAGFVLGLAAFYFVIMIPVDTYVSAQLDFSLKGLGDLLQIAYFNMKRYYTLIIREDFKTFWLVLASVLAVGYVWAAAGSSRRGRWAAAFAAASLVLMGLLCFGVYPLLAKALFAPRAMYGFGVLLALLALCAVEISGDYLFKLSSCALSLAFFTFSLTYGNALYVQKEYTDFRIQAVIGDLNDMEVFLGEEPVVVQISGTIGQSPVLAGMPQNYNILNRLVPITFREQWWWGQAGFYQFYGLKNVVRDPALDLTALDLPVLKDGMYHRIRGGENYILVELK